MKNVLFILFMLVAFLFGAVDFNSATKEELMEIKGIGEKKAEAIIEYRKTNKISSVEDLEAIKGFGPGLIEKIKNSNK
ncbi:DNA-binding protein [Halarcobacter ebronensis]|uniref:DNA-binding protein n=1 Tax=Halarcobacter ebronensis TaxID=1462615 RepID=A0A4Q0Y6U9_9BACT|nr:helix-hairpin-helix domain-containing protein [Halarcobacter ebronensis]RXJ65927.1 DNA-binding protein [Halarcobacter ebronensis]